MLEFLLMAKLEIGNINPQLARKAVRLAAIQELCEAAKGMRDQSARISQVNWEADGMDRIIGDYLKDLRAAMARVETAAQWWKELQ